MIAVPSINGRFSRPRWPWLAGWLWLGFAQAETLILIDPDGDQLVLETSAAIGFDYGQGSGLNIAAQVDLHLATMTFTAQEPSAFSAGPALLSVDGVDYVVGTLSSLLANTLNVSSPASELSCVSAGGVPMHPASNVEVNLDGASFDLHEAWPGVVARLQARVTGGATLTMVSVFDDLGCGSNLQNNLFIDSLESAP